MKIINPDIDWYKSESERLHVFTRCQYANVKKCYRYYASVSLLGLTGLITPIEKNKDDHLLAKWKKTEYFPIIKEEDASIFGIEKKSFNNFCTEVMGNTFGYFTNCLYPYQDEIDIENAHRKLKNDKLDRVDYRWTYSYINPLHYTECSMFCIIREHNLKKTKKEDILLLKPNFYGIGFDLNELLRYLFKKK